MRRLLWLFILYVFCFCSFPASATLAQTGEEGPNLPAATYPGTAEVVPRTAQLQEKASQVEVRIASLHDLSSFEKQIGSARQRQEELGSRIAELGDPAAWSADRLLEIRSRLEEQKSSLRKLLDNLSSRLAELETTRKEWTEKKTFWEGWAKALKGSQLQLPKKTFADARATIEVVLGKASKAAAPLVTLQGEVTALQAKNAEIFNQIEATLDNLRKEIFKKTAASFANPDYYGQFKKELWEQTKNGILSARKGGVEFLREQGWIFALQLLLAGVLAGFIIRHGSKVEVTREWQFILHHPLATGLFVAVSSLSFLYATPYGLWRLLLWSLAAFSAAVLISGLLRNPLKIFMVFLLSSLFVLSLALQIFALPQPLYRLYLALLSLAGIPLLLRLAQKNIRAHGGQIGGFTITLRAGAAVLLVAFVAQCGGYSNFSSRLIEASVQTVFLGLFAAMAIRLGHGGIEFFWNQHVFRNQRFFARFGHEIAERLKGLLKVFVVVFAGLQLLAVWGIFDTAAEAWDDLLDIGVSWGENEFSVKMVLLAGVALYASVVVSKMIGSLLETEFLPRSGLDRGLGDSIRKLLHYALITIGFLFAVSLMGVELKNFAVLAGAFGIGIGFGLQNIINNFVSGLILLFERPIKVGDMVVLGTDWGTVQKIGLRSTIVETFDRSEIIVPNSQLIAERVTNWTLSNSMARAIVPVGVAYGSDMDRVMAILSEAAQQHEDVLADPAPSPIFIGFGDSSLNFELRVWISDVNKRLTVRSDLGLYIDRRFREEGVEIPFPQRDLHLRSIDPALKRALSSGKPSETVTSGPS